jgi:hypothetical protein
MKKKSYQLTSEEVWNEVQEPVVEYKPVSANIPVTKLNAAQLHFLQTLRYIETNCLLMCLSKRSKYHAVWTASIEK